MKNYEINNHGMQNSLQPYLVSQAKNYKALSPIGSAVSLYYQFEVEENFTPISAIPDGCIDIVVCCRPDSPLSIMLYGPMYNTKAMQIEAGVTYFGVRFQPGSVPAIIHADAEDFIDRVAPLTTVSPSFIVKQFNRLQEFSTFKERVAHLESELNEEFITRKHRYNPALYSQLVNQILNCSGNVRITDLTTETGYSSRYINTVFLGNLGISPKEFCQQIRVQSALHCITNNHNMDCAELAISLGYFDQSHFINDFKNFTGTTPLNYMNNIVPVLKKFNKI